MKQYMFLSLTALVVLFVLFVGCSKENPITTSPIQNPAITTENANPFSLTYTKDRIWVANYGNSTIAEINLIDKSVKIHALSADCNPISIFYDGTYLLIANYGNNTVMKMTLEGIIIVTYKIPADKDKYTELYLNDVKSDGINTWVSSFGEGCLVRITPEGKISKHYPKYGRSGLRKMLFDGKYICVADEGTGTVSKFNTDGTLAATIINVGHTNGITSVGDYLYTANGIGGTVSKIISDSQVVHYSLEPFPMAITHSQNEDVWVTNTLADKITKISASGEITTYVLNSDSSKNFWPLDILFADGSIFTANYDNDSVTKLSLDGVVLDTYKVGNATENAKTNYWADIPIMSKD